MKKVLLIGYPFPLRQGGSPRLLGLAKYLPEFGWQPTILTAPLDQKPEPTYHVIETDYRNPLSFWLRLFRLNPDADLRRQVKQRLGVNTKTSLLDRLLTFAGEIVNYPDSEKGWTPFAIKAGNETIEKEGIDALISTSAPITAHIIAKELKRCHRIPWIADLRDLWSQNHNYSYSRTRRWFDKRLEIRTISDADALVTVSQPWAERLGALHKNLRVYTVTNGFDPDTLNDRPEDLTKKLTITYTGLVYPASQDTTKLFSALSDLISERIIDPANIEVRFYGLREDWLDKKIQEYRLTDVARQYGQVSRDIALQKQRESQVLWLLQWDDHQERGNFPGKVFEYLAAKRMILATGGFADNVVAVLLAETGAGIQATTATDTKEALRKLYLEFKAHGKVNLFSDETELQKYSQREMAGKFAKIIDSLAPK